ncbi:MAG: alpha/beta fold hydrolase, partial [Micrococcales bacterium]
SLEINKFCYAGVSLGGAIGLTLALRYPNRVNVVLPICSAPKFGDSDSWISRAQQVRENGTAQFVDGTRDRWFSKRYQERIPENVEQTLKMLETVDRESYALGCEALAKYDITNRLGEIDVPVMVVAGELDPVVPYSSALEYSQKLGAGSIIEVLGVAHQAVLEAPEVLAKHINYSVRQNK